MRLQTFMIDTWDFSQHPPQRVNDASALKENHWYHCQRNDAQLLPWLQSVGVEPELAQAAVEEDTRPRFQKVGDDGFFMILRGVNLNPGAEPDDMLTLGMLYHQGSLITLRRRQFNAILNLRERLEAGRGASSLADLTMSIIELMQDRIGKILHETEHFIEQVEDQMDNLSKAQQHELTMMHRRLLKLSRFLKPQMGALSSLEKSERPIFSGMEQRIANVRNEAQSISESIDSYLDHIWILREHMQQAQAELMNRNTYWLSMVAGVFLPLGFLTGLFGINIGGMPGTEDPTAFALFCIGLILLGVIEFLLFRRLKFL